LISKGIGTVESHFHSQNIAISAGFFPAWAELYSRAKEAKEDKKDKEDKEDKENKE